MSRGPAVLYAERPDGRSILSLEAILSPGELSHVMATLRRLYSEGYLSTFEAYFIKPEDGSRHPVKDSGQVLKYVDDLTRLFIRRDRPMMGARDRNDVYWDPRTHGEEEDEVLLQELTESFARTIFVLAWADAMEEDGISLSQVDLMKDAPKTSPGAFSAARKFMEDFGAANNRPVSKLYEQLLLDDDLGDTGKNRGDFGYYMAMEALGHGVSWADDHHQHSLEVPDIDFGMHDLLPQDYHLAEWEYRRVPERSEG